MTRSRPYLLSLIYSVLDAVLYAVIGSVLFCTCVPNRLPPTAIRFRERVTFANRVLGAGVEPAHLAALEPKSSVSAIPPPEQNL